MEKEYAKELLAKTKKDYILIANDFSRTRKKPWPETDFLFEDYLEPNDKALDMGCGNGRYYPYFKKEDAVYFGVDNSEPLINIARKRLPEANFVVGDGLSLSFPNDFFDKVFSIAVLHQIPSHQYRMKFLKEARRVLKPKGLLVLTVWKFHRPRELFTLLRYSVRKILGSSRLDWGDVFIPWGEKTERYYHYFSGKGFKELLLEADFRILELGLAENRTETRQNIYAVARKPQ